jgi:Fe2+ transport system protein B
MTTQQQQIVDLLIAEFNKSNKPMPTGFARLSEATSAIDEWRQLKKQIYLSNDAWDDLRDERIHTDADSLKEQIKAAGVPISVSVKNGVITLNYERHHVSENIQIHYAFRSKPHQAEYDKELIAEYTGLFISWYNTAFRDIEHLFQDEFFFQRWTQLVNKSISLNSNK